MEPVISSSSESSSSPIPPRPSMQWSPEYKKEPVLKLTKRSTSLERNREAEKFAERKWRQRYVSRHNEIMRLMNEKMEELDRLFPGYFLPK